MIIFFLSFPWQLYPIELLRLLISLRLLELWQLIYPRFSTGFGMLFFFTKSNLMEFRVGYLPLFRLFSTIDGFKWFSQEVFARLPSFYWCSSRPYSSSSTLPISMTSMMMLSVMVLSMLMILQSTPSVTRYLIFCNS